MMLPVTPSSARTPQQAQEGAVPLWTPDAAPAVNPRPLRDAVAALAERAEIAARPAPPAQPAKTDGEEKDGKPAPDAPPPPAREDAYAVQRALAIAHKTLLEVEARNAALRAREDGTIYTRLDTMPPFHPDDLARIEREAARLRAIVLAEGRLIGWREAMAELAGKSVE